MLTYLPQLLLRTLNILTIIQIGELLPQTRARLQHWLHLLSDQNLDLYTPSDWLIPLLPFYIDIFLTSLVVYARTPGVALPNQRQSPLPSNCLTLVLVFAYVNWLGTAMEYVWMQPGVAGKCLAVVDLCVEQVCVIVLAKVALQVVAVLANWPFGWRAVRDLGSLGGPDRAWLPASMQLLDPIRQVFALQVQKGPRSHNLALQLLHALLLPHTFFIQSLVHPVLIRPDRSDDISSALAPSICVLFPQLLCHHSIIMGSLRFSEYADSPTVFLPQQQQTTFCPSSFTHLIQHHQPWKPIMDPAFPTTSQTSSLKRSREESPAEYAAFTDSKVQRVASSNSLQDEGMTEVFTAAGRAVSRPGGSQTWLDGQTEQSLQDTHTSTSQAGEKGRRKFQKQDAGQRPSATADPVPASELSLAPEELTQAQLVAQLGVGWDPSKDSHWQAAALGWARYIEKTFPLKNVKVLAKHTDGNHLVKATDGLYMFDENMTVGALIGKSWGECVKELRDKHGFTWEDRQLCLPIGLPSSSDLSESTKADSVSEESNFDAMSASSTAPLPSSSPVEPSDPEPWLSDAVSPRSTPPGGKDCPGTAVSGQAKEFEDVEMAMD
ncbi:MAG: hypothetical protein Q9173_001180 [Seirophora scorigena]